MINWLPLKFHDLTGTISRFEYVKDTTCNYVCAFHRCSFHTIDMWHLDALLLSSSASGFHCKKGSIHQVTTTLVTSKIVLFPGHNHLLTTGTDDPSLARWRLGDNQSVRSSVLVVSRWLWPGNRTFLEVAIAWWLPGGLWLFCSTFSHFHAI